MKRKTILIAAAFFTLWFVDAMAAGQVLSDHDLEAMAGNKYASGELPLGDGHYITNASRKGYIYLCHIMHGEGGAQVNGKWIHGNTWNIYEKIAVQGRVTWDAAQFSDTLENGQRVLTGNGLPINHPTGIFPVRPSDPAYALDRNPNSIAEQALHDVLPAEPVYSDTPHCMGGEAGVMLNGVPLFNGFDAGMRDAAAHEVQDSCEGHPQRLGQYHYHSLSSCIKDVSEKSVIGYALDGFPITGPEVSPGKYLTTDNLDECHGITSEITVDGRKKVTYHYVMTQDFPYSISCFRGAPTRIGPSGSARMQMRQMPENMPPQGMPPMPPREAMDACSGKGMGDSCRFVSSRGDTIEGSCKSPSGRPAACVPEGMP